MRRLAPIVLLALLVPAAPGDAAKKPTRKRCEVVVFKRKGKTVRRCRLAARKPVPKVTPLPSLPAPPVVPPPAPAGALPPEVPAPAAEPEAGGAVQQRDPWFLTVHARDVGNGDFRLLPQIGDIPAGTLYLSYLNEDQTPHDLWLNDTQIFAPYVGDELQRTRLELQPGTYELLCRITGHDQMRRAFRVTP